MAAAYSNSWVDTTPAIPLPVVTAPTVHDVLIAGMTSDNSGGGNLTTLPTGFISDGNVSSTFDGMTLACAHKLDATGTEGTLNFSFAAIAPIGFVLSVSGADNVTPLDVAVVSVVTIVGQASPWAQAATITPVTNGCLIIPVFGSDTANGGALTSVVFSGGGLAWTTRQNLNDGGGFKAIAVGTAIQAVAAPITVTATGTKAGDTAGRGLFLFAVRPASGGGPIYIPPVLTLLQMLPLASWITEQPQQVRRTIILPPTPQIIVPALDVNRFLPLPTWQTIPVVQNPQRIIPQPLAPTPIIPWLDPNRTLPLVTWLDPVYRQPPPRIISQPLTPAPFVPPPYNQNLNIILASWQTAYSQQVKPIYITPPVIPPVTGVPLRMLMGFGL